MAIYTPTGLKIRIPLEYAFGLMARLYPKVDAFKVLKTTEGIELLPSLASFITALVCFIINVEPIYICIAVFVAYMAAALINLKGFYIIPQLVAFGTLYSYLGVFRISWIIEIAVGLLLAGWQAVIAFLVGKFFAWCICQVLEFTETKRLYGRLHKLAGNSFMGFGLTASERHFFNAYRLHASRLGITTDIELSDEELEKDHWEPVFLDLAKKWPKVVARFTPT